MSSSTTTLYSPSSTGVKPVTARTNVSIRSERSSPNAETTAFSSHPLGFSFARPGRAASKSLDPSTHVSGISSGSRGGHTHESTSPGSPEDAGLEPGTAGSQSPESSTE